MNEHATKLAQEQMKFIDSQITQARRRIHGLSIDQTEIQALEDFEKFCEIQKRNLSEKYNFEIFHS